MILLILDSAALSLAPATIRRYPAALRAYEGAELTRTGPRYYR